MCVKSNKKPLVGCFVVWVSACWMHHLEISHCFIPAPEDYTFFQQRILLRTGTETVSLVFVRSAFVSLGVIWIWSAIQFFFFNERIITETGLLVTSLAGCFRGIP
jgi:hypothetical protein